MLCGRLSAQTTFSLPSVPDSLRTPELRAEYLLLHYWDNMDFKSSGLKSQETEQAFADFASVLPVGTSMSARAGVDTLMNRASVNASHYRIFASLAEKYLYETASPVRNDSIFALFLEHQVASSHFSDEERSRHEFLLKSVRRNAPGTIASDFAYAMSDGRRETLLKTAPGIPLLLVFYDLDCSHCQDVIFSLRYNSALNLCLRSGSIKVLAVCLSDENSKQTVTELPKTWLSGNDNGTLSDKDLYDLRTLPAVYLLDSEKRVVLKNTTSKEISQYLLNND